MNKPHEWERKAQYGSEVDGKEEEEKGQTDTGPEWGGQVQGEVSPAHWAAEEVVGLGSCAER